MTHSGQRYNINIGSVFYYTITVSGWLIETYLNIVLFYFMVFGAENTLDI